MDRVEYMKENNYQLVPQRRCADCKHAEVSDIFMSQRKRLCLMMTRFGVDKYYADVSVDAVCDRYED